VIDVGSVGERPTVAPCPTRGSAQSHVAKVENRRGISRISATQGHTFTFAALGYRLIVSATYREV